MLKAKVQTIVLRSVHHSQVETIRIVSVSISLGLVADITQINQTLFAQRRRLVCERHRLIPHSKRRLIDLSLIIHALHRVKIHVAEHLILLVPDFMNAFQKGLILRDNCPKRKTVDTCTAGFLLKKRRPARIRNHHGNIVTTVHLLQVCADSHNEQTLQ